MLGLANTVRYTLNFDGKDPVLIPEPIGYDEGNGNVYEWEESSKGYITKKKSGLEYHGAGYETLVGIYATEGIVPDVREIKEVKSPDRIDERWEPVGETFIDTSKMKKDDVKGVVTAESVQGGLKREIDDAWNEEYDLTLETSEEEIDIGPPETIDVTIDGREIFLRSNLKVDDSITIKAIVTGADGLNARAIPLNIESNSDDLNVRGVYGTQLSAVSGGYAQIEEFKRDNTFYFEAEKDTTIFLSGNIKVTQTGTSHSGTFYLDLARFNGDNYDFVEIVTPIGGSQARVVGNPDQTGSTVELLFDKTEIRVFKGDSLAISTLSNTSDGIEFKAEGTLTIEEDSFEAPSISRAFLPFQLFERLIANSTGKTNRFKSNLFSTGKWALLAVAPVWWIRQFPDIVNEGTEEERRIQAKTKLLDAFDSYSAVEPLAWWVERVGNIEVVRIEPLRFTQQNFVGIHYGTSGEGLVNYIEVSNLESETLPDNFFKTITVGAEIGGDGYEDVQGLQSVGGKAVFKTINKKGGTDYEKTSKYAMAAEYVELPRRRPYSKFPETDTRYDSSWVFLDLKLVNGKYVLRKWQDDFEEAPKNVYRPNSLFNARLTPAQCLLRHDFVIKTGLFHRKHMFRNIRWISSDCNSSLITKKAGEDELKEDGLINHTRLSSPTLIPEMDTFEMGTDALVTLEIEKQITGTTLIDGEEIPNWFGLVAYKKRGEIHYGRLAMADTNKSFKNEVVHAYLK
jgi:hypothetical protein